MAFNLFGKKVRGRFGFPSGVIATNDDTARWLLANIPQLGFFVGKSTTIEPRQGNPEDIFVLLNANAGVNAVGYANPGLADTIEGFCALKETVPDGVFLMPQLGESSEESFAHCAAEFDKLGDVVDGLELNLSCPHAEKGGILIGSDPKTAHAIVAAVRRTTKKPLVVKLNAGVGCVEELARAALRAGADGLSAINTLGGAHPELSNQFGGLSGPALFAVTRATVARLRKETEAPMIVMGGIAGASDIRLLDSIDGGFFYAIGTALAEMDSEQLRTYFRRLEEDLAAGTDTARQLTVEKKCLQYRPFIVREVVTLAETLKLFRFRENVDASIGQFVFLKVGNGLSKPFSVSDDREQLELVIRKVGPATSRIFELRENEVVRIKGPYGRAFHLPAGSTVVFVGAGCGIAPIHHAACHHRGRKHFVIGAREARELVYCGELARMGELHIATDDGSRGFRGTVAELLSRFLQERNPGEAIFFNCGPEIAMKKADELERQYAAPGRIHHLVERMTSCGVGICGKCSIPGGARACVDGPVFEAVAFRPCEYTRDKTGKKVVWEEAV